MKLRLSLGVLPPFPRFFFKVHSVTRILTVGSAGSFFEDFSATLLVLLRLESGLIWSSYVPCALN